MQVPSLLYAEDDLEIAEMTCEVLSEQYLVDHVVDGRMALDHALRRRYAVMVFDRRLPGLDGIALVRAIRTARIQTPILLLTALGAVDDRVAGLDAGANDYLVKPFAFDELLARLRALGRAFAVEGQRCEIGSWTFTPEAQVLYTTTGARVALTETESRLLAVLSASPEHIFTREELLDAVFHHGSDEIGPGSVDTYVHYVRRKAVPEIIDTVRGRGYRLGASE